MRGRHGALLDACSGSDRLRLRIPTSTIASSRSDYNRLIPSPVAKQNAFILLQPALLPTPSGLFGEALLKVLSIKYTRG
jgi:hypothetical protein